MIDDALAALRAGDYDDIENGDRVFIRFRGALRGKGSGITAEADTFHVWTLRDGLIARIVVVPERAEAERLAGLS